MFPELISRQERRTIAIIGGDDRESQSPGEGFPLRDGRKGVDTPSSFIEVIKRIQRAQDKFIPPAKSKDQLEVHPLE